MNALVTKAIAWIDRPGNKMKAAAIMWTVLIFRLLKMKLAR